MSHLFGVTTHGYDRPVAAAVCPRILSEYQARNAHPDKYCACDLGRTAAVFPDRDLRQADVLYGSNDGYSYGSNQRSSLLRRRSLPPAEAPRDTYRLAVLTNMRYHWFLGDPALAAGWDRQATRTPLGQCEVAGRRDPPPRVAGLTSRQVDRAIRLQERGLIKRATVEEGSLGSAGLSAGGQTAGQRAPPAAEAAAGEQESADGPTQPRQVCEERLLPHLWYKHRRRYPQFYSAMTRFVETVRINDKLFEMY